MLRIGKILTDICFHRFIPLFAVPVRRLTCHKPHGVKLAVAGRPDRLLELPPQRIIRDKNIGDLKSRKVKGLARRRAGHHKFPVAFLESRQHLMRSLKDEIRVDFIADHNHSVPLADVTQPQKLLLCPHPADRVVRVAEEKELHLTAAYFFFKIRKIDPVSSVLSLHERVIHNLPAVIADYLRKRIVDRLLQQHRVTRLGERPHRLCQRKNNPRRLDQPGFLHVPSVMPTHPARNRLKVATFRLAVAEDAVRHAARERLLYIGRNLEIHVGNPKRQYVLRLSPLYRKIIFE